MSRYVTRDYRTYNTIIKDCPIILNKTRILFDIETNKIILQISINNLSNKNIKKIIFNITTYDIENEVIDNNKTIIIEELINSNTNHSIKTPIIFENKNINFANIGIKKVFYTNGNSWSNIKNRYEKEINKSNRIYTDSDLYKTLCFYNVNFVKKCYPEFNKNYWRCSCSTLNLYSSNNCRLCNASKSELNCFFEYKNIENLIEKYKQIRLNELKEKLIKVRKIMFIFLIMLLIVILLIFAVNMYFNNVSYNKALKLYNEKKYIESIVILEEKNDNKSKELLSNIYYDYGHYLLENKNYMNALDYFEKTSHKGKINSIKETNYLLALDYFSNKKYNEAINCFKKVKDYKNTNDYIKRAEEDINSNNYSTYGPVLSYEVENYDNEEDSCIDANGNVVCQVYIFEIKSNFDMEYSDSEEKIVVTLSELGKTLPLD